MRLSILALLVFTVLIVSACGSSPEPFKLAAASLLPDYLDNAPARTREAYRFAIANREELAKYPCYCGCGNLGHTSNLECYIDVDVTHALALDEHGSGCGICVDITQDVMQGLREGKSTEEIRAGIDATYGNIGTSTGHME
ncbi:MAG: PCYCGC motif-containing (lipo)protein [bacterium]|nr:PCYCGC motif-containing (lipo)protein [bacterium]